MRVYIEKEDKTKEFEFAGTGMELLKKLGIDKENILLVRNGEVVPEEETLEDKDDVKLLSVVSGG